jgi:HAE1 family hydrophobic/amphiphilic exporter-1
MKKLADLPHDRPVATLMALVSLMVLGVVAIFRLPLDFLPIVEPPFIIVRVPYPGSHPLENLRQIVEPLEEEVATVSELKNLYATAEPGSASVRAEFDWSVDLDLKKLEVREAVDRALPHLPQDIGVIRLDTHRGGPGDGALMEARISAQRDLSESWELLERRIRRPLERIRGVASVDLGGVEPQQVRIEIDPAALRRHNVQPRDLVAALQAAHLDLDAGAVHGDVLRYDVRTLGRFVDLDDIASLPLAHGDIRVGDVATVAIREPWIDYGRHLDRRFAISLQVFKEASANTVEVADALMARIAEIQQDPELEGIQLLVWQNAGSEIRNSLGGLRDAGLFGGLLVVIVLYLFLRRWRTTLVVAVAIPFSLVVTCGVMYLLGAQFNVLTLLGLMLGVGMLVDNAVVVMENIHRLQSRGMEAVAAARLGARQVALAVVAATATTVCVWSWLFFAERSHMSIYLGQVALTICIAVACSLLISLTFIPLASGRFVPTKRAAAGFLAGRAVPAYRRLLDWTLRHRLVTLTGLFLLALSAAWPILKIEKTSQPKEREVFAQVFLRSEDPTTKEIMETHVDRIEEWVEANRDRLDYDSLYSWYTERGVGIVRLYVDPEEATEARIAELTDKLRDIAPIPGVRMELGDSQWWRHGGGKRRMVPVALHGEDPDYLGELADRLDAVLRELPDAIDVWSGRGQAQYEARVLVDPEKARSLGISPRRIAETVGLTYRGRNLRRFQRQATELEMLVALPEDLRPGVASLADLPIPRDDGSEPAAGDPVPLGAVAELVVSRIDPRIERENRQTTAWVTVEFEPAVTTEEARRRVSEAMAGVDLPEGYSWDFGQWGHRHQEGLDTMILGVTMSLAAVVLLMAALFESFAQPVAILITLPPAFFGGFWLLWLLGYELDVVAFMGVIILIGIVVNNGIVLVDHVNQLRAEGLDRRAALLRGCGDRLRPVLMTAISTVFGLLPLASSAFTVATAYVDSLAIAVIGGLTTSTLFTLIGLPVWYATLEDFFRGVRRSLPQRVRAEGRSADAAPAVAPAE